MRRDDINEDKFVLLPEAEELAVSYEVNRVKYRSFDRFLPVLIRQFGNYNRNEMDRRIREMEFR